MNYLQSTIQKFGEFVKRNKHNLEFFSEYEKVWHKIQKWVETADFIDIRNLNIYSSSDGGVKGSV